MKKALIGYGGHAREVMAQMKETLPCFVDDEYVNEFTLPLSSLSINEYSVMIAVSNPIDRYNLVSKLSVNTTFFTFIHPTALILDTKVKIGNGSFIGAYSVVTTNVELGNHCILNRSNHIGHDCKIGNYFSAMPGSIVSGNCNISDLVYLGSNSSVREKINICSNVTIGLNSGVVKDIDKSGIYVGCPSKIINR
jgi:sugar O-acyltransferase (sialic acid O-acetyltransferase NeuD family)